MPRGDGTGPMGKGPFTGRSAGYCAGYANPLYGAGTTQSTGMGRGLRCRRMFRNFSSFRETDNLQDISVMEKKETVNVDTSEINEIKAMKAQIDFITKSLAVVTEKLEHISKSVEPAE